MGRIATLAGRSGPGWVEALAVEAGRVVAAGRWHDVAAAVRGHPTVWRVAEGQVVLPGITDAHLHVVTAARAARQLDLTRHADRGAVMAAIREAHLALEAAGDRDGWLEGHGWSLDQLAGRPDGAALEVVAPGRPVVLWSHDHHSRWVSERVLALAGLGSGTADPPDGTLGRRADGSLDGLLYEHAGNLIDDVIPSPSVVELEEGLGTLTAQLASRGVIGAHDPGDVVKDPALAHGPTFYRALARAGRLPMRIVASVREESLAAARETGFATGQRVGERYRDGWLKLFADGALGSRTAALLEPYAVDDPAGSPVGGPRGMLLRSAPALLDAVRVAAGAGIAAQIHAIGDAAVRIALEVLATESPPRGSSAGGGPRHRVEHAQLIDALDVSRFARAGVAASVQPCHLITDARPARVAWGPRTARAFPLRDLAAADVLIPFGTDAPVEPVDPWRGIAAAVTRASGSWAPNEEPFHPEQAIDLWRAIRAATLDPALSLGVADEGHLGVGARADLIVVPSDVVDEPPRVGGVLESARPLATLIDGEVVYRSDDFDP